jgi:uncharacterized membrane protein YjjP (DUF1212 family)
MEVALKAGEILLCSGAEIYRVEDTISRICKNYGVDCESFVLPTGIFISTGGGKCESVSLIKRIRERSVDLHRIERINEFSRGLQKKTMSYEEAMKTLEDIQNTRQYNFITRLVAAGITAFVFTMLFKGNVKEASAALLISTLIYLINEKISGIGLFRIFELFVSGVIIGALSLLTVRIIPDLSIYKIIIGSVMILVPGVTITNGMRDALHGDINSSMLRLGEAVFVAAAVGGGVGFMLSIGLLWV